MRFRRPRLLYGVVLVLLLGAVSFYALRDLMRGSAFVVKAADIQGLPRTLAEWEADAVTEDRLQIPWRKGMLPARKYLPRDADQRAFLLVPGVHASGVEEPRLVQFARNLASLGHPVVTIGPPDLARYTISAAASDAIEDAASWLADQAELAPDGRISMMGISFAGGLSVVAAGREPLRHRVEAGVSLGGHGDFQRTLAYLCTGTLPDGTRSAPHDYGVVIILLGVADRLVPDAQVEPLRQALLTFLEASRLDLIDKALSAQTFEKARALETGLPEPSRTIMSYVNHRDVAKLGPLLLPHLPAIASDPALSPERSAAPSADVYLLHGADDNVIPAAESFALAANLRSRGAAVRVLATPLITHAEVDASSRAADVVRLFTFWAAVLGS